MDTTRLNLLLEAIDEIKRLEDNRLEDEGYVLEEGGVGETAAVYGLTLAALTGIGLLVRKLNKKKSKTDYHKYMQQRKKLRSEVKKNLKYTLDEFIGYGGRSVVKNIENSDKVSMKVRQGINKAITAFNVQVSKCTNQVMKVKLSPTYEDDILDITGDYINPIDDIIDSISDTKWVEESNPKNIMSQIVNIYDNILKLETIIETISNDCDVSYYATRDMYSQFEDLCSAIKISGIKHQALKQFDYDTKNSKEYQKYSQYHNKKK